MRYALTVLATAGLTPKLNFANLERDFLIAKEFREKKKVKGEKNLGKLIIEALKANNWTQTKLGASINFDRREIYKIVKQGFIPPKKTVIEICVALKLDILSTIEFMHYAGYVLSPTIKTDKKSIIFIIENKQKAGLKRVLDYYEFMEDNTK